MSQEPRAPGLRAFLRKDLAWLLVMAMFFVFASLLWAKWGDLRIDCGREMYVPQEIVSGKLLYRDLWYPYGPLAPYLVAISFRLLGVHLNTLYLTGLALTAGFGLLLLALARRFGSTTFALLVVLCFFLQAFQPTLFNFVLPYAYASAFGAFLSSLVLYWLVLRMEGGSQFYLYGCGIASGLALLTKLEFGAACLLSYLFYLLSRVISKRSLKAGLLEGVPILPGLTVAGLGYGWFIWKVSLNLLLGENLQYAGSYVSLARRQGFNPEGGQFWILIFFLAVSLALWGMIGRGLNSAFHIASMAGGIVVILTCLVVAGWVLVSPQFQQNSALMVNLLAFPTGMYWLCPVVLVWQFSRWIKTGYCVQHLTRALLAFHAMTVGIRIMFHVWPLGPAIYYNLPVFMVFLLVLNRLGQPSATELGQRAWLVSTGMLAIEATALALVLYPRQIARSEPIETDKGRIYGRPSEAAVFPEIVQFLKQRKAGNESVAILPEETSLYFLSGTHAPSRWYMLHPGILDLEGRQRRYISDLETHQVKYILLSNRTTEEYGFPFFGLDFNQNVYQWIQTNFELIGEFGRFSRKTPEKFGMQIYRRRKDATVSAELPHR